MQEGSPNTLWSYSENTGWIIRYSSGEWLIQSNTESVDTVDTAKELILELVDKYIQPRNSAKQEQAFISTIFKWFTLGITLKLLHIYLHSSYRFLKNGLNCF